jgi:hypothetical protein
MNRNVAVGLQGNNEQRGCGTKKKSWNSVYDILLVLLKHELQKWDTSGQHFGVQTSNPHD